MTFTDLPSLANQQLTIPIWSDYSDRTPSATTFQQLADGDIPCIRSRQFLNPEECAAVVQAIQDQPMDFYPGVQPPIQRLGITQFEHGPEGKDLYLENAKIANARNRLIADRLGWNLLDRVVAFLQVHLPDYKVHVASTSDGRSYFAGLFRRINAAARLHYDDARFDAGEAWEIGHIHAQLACNIYLTPVAAGECVVYNRHPKLSKDHVLRGASYNNVTQSMIDGAQAKVLTPDLGDLTFFNSFNFHEVKPAVGDRVTFTCFVGLTDDQRALIWS